MVKMVFQHFWPNFILIFLVISFSQKTLSQNVHVHWSDDNCSMLMPFQSQAWYVKRSSWFSLQYHWRWRADLKKQVFQVKCPPHELIFAIVNDGSCPLSTSRPNLSELEELFPDLSSFAKSDSGMIWLVTILWCHHNLISLNSNRQCTDCNVLSILQAWKVWLCWKP